MSEIPPYPTTGLFSMPADEFKAMFWRTYVGMKQPRDDFTMYGQSSAAALIANEAAECNAAFSSLRIYGVTRNGRPNGDWLIKAWRVGPIRARWLDFKDAIRAAWESLRYKKLVWGPEDTLDTMLSKFGSLTRFSYEINWERLQRERRAKRTAE